MSKRIILFFFLLTMVAISCNDDQLEIKPSSPGDRELNSKSSESGRTTSAATLSTTTSCAGSFSNSVAGTGTSLNPITNYTYPLQPMDVSCAVNGATVTVSVNAKVYTSGDFPNHFTIRDAANNIIAASDWLGTATFTGPWGASLNNSGSTQLSFTKSANTYYLQVETVISSVQYTPSPYNRDFWEASLSCTCGPVVTPPPSCGGSFSDKYSGTGYYTYTLKTVDVSCAANGTTFKVDVNALSFPNNFVILDAAKNVVTQSGWLGSANYYGPWGSSLNKSGSATLTFTKSASTYYLQVYTVTPYDYFTYSPGNVDSWSANIHQ